MTPVQTMQVLHKLARLKKDPARWNEFLKFMQQELTDENYKFVESALQELLQTLKPAEK